MIHGRVSKSPFLPAWVWLIPLAAIVLLYGALQQGASHASERIVWYSIFIIAGTWALTWGCRMGKEFDLLEPIYVVFGFFVIWYPVRALFAVWLDESWFDPSKATVWKGLSASVLGFACFAIGYKLGARRFRSSRRIWLDRDWNSERAKVVSLVFLFLGLTGFVALRFLGGSLFYFISLDPDIKSPTSIAPWFYYLFWICMFIQVGALVQLGSWLSTGRRTLWTVLYGVLATLSTFLLSRYSTVLFLMTSALCWHYKKRKIRGGEVVVALIVLVGYLGIAGLYREWISPGSNLDEVGPLAELAGDQKQLALKYVVGNLEQLSNLTEVISMTPSELPYQFGATFAPVFLKPVPRVLMPAKPLGASAVFSRQLIPDEYESGLATGLGAWGEWYLNFSWLGLVLGMALMGALAAVASKAMQATKEFGRVLLFSSFVPLLLTWLRNDFNAATTFGLYYFIPAILALAYITKPKPTRESLG